MRIDIVGRLSERVNLGEVARRNPEAEFPADLPHECDGLHRGNVRVTEVGIEIQFSVDTQVVAHQLRKAISCQCLSRLLKLPNVAHRLSANSTGLRGTWLPRDCYRSDQPAGDDSRANARSGTIPPELRACTVSAATGVADISQAPVTLRSPQPIWEIHGALRARLASRRPACRRPPAASHRERAPDSGSGSARGLLLGLQ